MENDRKVIAMGEYEDMVGEIYLERARYLLNTDEMLEEMLGKTQNEITDNIKVESGWKAGTVCCGVLVGTDEAHETDIKTGEQFIVCGDNCRKFVEMATA